MHGLVLVTWEKFLAERFGQALLHNYRLALRETPATTPLVNRVYTDDMMLAGVEAAHKLTGTPVNTLLREYGRYYIMNGLTSHLCAYLLTQAHSGRDLLLMMRDAHAQMRRVPEGLTPPLFNYQTFSTHPDGLMLGYDSPRKLCPLLLGAIEGAAQRYGEKAEIIERTCMLRGASSCLFEIHFRPDAQASVQTQESPQQRERRRQQQQLANVVLKNLPDHAGAGVTLSDVQKIVQLKQGPVRLSVLLEALNHLQHAGLVASTANRPGDTLASRQYWRVPRSDRGQHSVPYQQFAVDEW